MRELYFFAICVIFMKKHCKILAIMLKSDKKKIATLLKEFLWRFLNHKKQKLK